ncbi:MAG: carbohydrate ABC transporter permease [Armatimonadota bacterium]|nr:carbohydrate ABC transporter permease [Armatimonadota bacterium]MDR7443018.1 carbohydrate ABC transporter permease [Armatimonadota bacterium]MDR7569378.1 carbohydrate ABC transporter permease [Armatimonadota bacterium]MDR7614527.1 carbohydrate ABC transporter permease [Armatimonadota bacterium]
MVRKLRVALGHALLYGLLCGIALLTLFPFLWTLSTALSTAGGVFTFPPRLIPERPGLANFVEVVQALPVGRYFLNSVLLTVYGVLGTLLVCSLAAYPLARMDFPGRDAILAALLGTLLLPNEAGFVVNFLTLGRLGLVNTYTGVVLPSLASVVGIFLLRQAYLAIPQELLDAARVDGASELRIWARVVLPLSRPALAALGILSSVAYWNAFIWPLVVLRDPDRYPLAVGLLYLQGLFAHNTRLIAAGTVLAMLPILAMFVFAQRSFMRGLEGAVR